MAMPVAGIGPLRGSSIYLLVEAESIDAARQAVRAFGGQVASTPELATHCLVPDGLASDSRRLARIRPELERCASCGVVIIEVSWLEEVVSLVDPGETWERVLVDPHISPATAELSGCSSKRARRPASDSCDRSVAAGLPGPDVIAGRRRTHKARLSASLGETLGFLQREYPEEVEAGQLRHAIDLSLLECAVTLRRRARGEEAAADESPEVILGVPKGASAAEVKTAYKKKALYAHPDKGGDPLVFSLLQQAYTSLTRGHATDYEASGRELLALPAATGSGASRDFELREHRALVESWFSRHGENLDRHVAAQQAAMDALGLEVCDVGSRNKNERGEMMLNQCFYLSLARAYLFRTSEDRAVLEETALHFKRVVEAAVLAAHPDWGGKRVGEDVQAFSDFLFFVLGNHALMSELCVTVFDSVSGGVEIYKGKHYPAPEAEDRQRENLLAIRYIPGHYQALLHAVGRGPTLAEMLACLEERGVLYVVTDG